MSITLLSSPDDTTTLLPSVAWTFQMNTEGIYPIEKRLFYELFQGGNQLTQRRVINYSPNPIRVDFSEVIAGQVFTPLPSPISTRTLQNVDASQVKEFAVRYGEYSLNRETGVQVEDGTTFTGTIKVIHAAVPYDELNLYASAANNVFMTRRPEYYQTCRTQYDWIYVRPGSSTIWAKLNFVTAPIPFTLDFSAVQLDAETVYAIPAGGGNLIDSFTNTADASFETVMKYVKAVEISFYEADPDAAPETDPFKTYVAEVNSCCEDGNQTELYFLEAPGGFASFRFDEVRWGASREYSTVEPAWDVRGSLEYRLKTGGSQVATTTAFQTMQLSKRIPNVTEQQEKFLRQILSTKETYLKVLGADGTPYPLRVLVEGGTFTTRVKEDFTEMRINVRVNKDLLSL